MEDELSELLDQNERQISAMERKATPAPNESPPPPPPPLPPRQISPPPLIESLMSKEEDIYCSVDELRAKSKVTRTPVEDELHDKMKKVRNHTIKLIKKKEISRIYSWIF